MTIPTRIIPTCLLLATQCSALASVYYVSSSEGNDAWSGESVNQAWQSLDKVNNQTFGAGDQILFRRGDAWQGMLHLKGSGNAGAPILLSNYGDGPLPLIDGNGYQACILLYNDGFVEIDGFELTNEASHLDEQGIPKKLDSFLGETNDYGSGKSVRFGVKIVADAQSVASVDMTRLHIHDIYPTPDNLANVHLGYGIKFETRSDTTTNAFHVVEDVSVTDCFIERTGHYGIWIKSLGIPGVDDVKNDGIRVADCTFSHTGGSGFVPNKSQNIVVEHCLFNHSGSGIDQRMWNRGSGMWTFDCKDAVIQNNRFMNAHGYQDSYAAHIDYGNENVVIQYNLSSNNEGGFAEVLGDNVRCGYRYNISVNDGYRVDPEGDPWDRKGKIFWVSTYCGGPVRCPSEGTFFYNNTVFVGPMLNPEIYVWPESGDVHIHNNLIFMSDDGEILETLLEDDGNEYFVSHNLFHPPGRISLDSDLAVLSNQEDPAFLNTSNPLPTFELNYQIDAQSPAFQAGTLIAGSEDSQDYLNNNGERDFLGQPVSSTNPPSIGAIEGNLCGTGATWSPELNQCLPNDPGCLFDLDGDGSVSTMDLLYFLSLFQSNC